MTHYLQIYLFLRYMNERMYIVSFLYKTNFQSDFDLNAMRLTILKKTMNQMNPTTTKNTVTK